LKLHTYEHEQLTALHLIFTWQTLLLEEQVNKLKEKVSQFLPASCPTATQKHQNAQLGVVPDLCFVLFAASTSNRR